MYNNNNIFNQIINGKIKSEKIYEDDFLIIIKDIKPKNNTHILILPKSKDKDFEDFILNNTCQNVYYFFKKIIEITKIHDIKDYKLVSHKGKNMGQEIFHFHFHLISSKKINDSKKM